MSGESAKFALPPALLRGSKTNAKGQKSLPLTFKELKSKGIHYGISDEAYYRDDIPCPWSECRHSICVESRKTSRRIAAFRDSAHRPHYIKFVNEVDDGMDTLLSASPSTKAAPSVATSPKQPPHIAFFSASTTAQYFDLLDQSYWKNVVFLNSVLKQLDMKSSFPWTKFRKLLADPNRNFVLFQDDLHADLFSSARAAARVNPATPCTPTKNIESFGPYQGIVSAALWMRKHLTQQQQQQQQQQLSSSASATHPPPIVIVDALFEALVSKHPLLQSFFSSHSILILSMKSYISAYRMPASAVVSSLFEALSEAAPQWPPLPKKGVYESGKHDDGDATTDDDDDDDDDDDVDDLHINVEGSDQPSHLDDEASDPSLVPSSISNSIGSSSSSRFRYPPHLDTDALQASLRAGLLWEGVLRVNPVKSQTEAMVMLKRALVCSYFDVIDDVYP